MEETPERRTLDQRRLYGILIALLAVALLVLVALLVMTRGQQDATTPTTTPPVSPGSPTLLYAVNGPGGGSFRPRGAAIIGSRVYVADSEGGRLAVLDLARGADAELAFIPLAPDRPGETLPQQPRPAAVAAVGGDQPTLLVTDTANGTLWRLGRDGTLLGAFPDPREAERSELTKPVGVAAHEGEVYVTDVGDQRVKVYSDTGRFLRAFGGAGYLPGQFSFPNGVAVAGDGSVIVADSNNRRVQVLTPEGRSLLIIERASAEEQLALPRSVALDRFGRLHVADTFDQAVFAFSPDGRYLFDYGRSSDPVRQVKLPEGVATSTDRIVVSDSGNGRLLVYGY